MRRALPAVRSKCRAFVALPMPRAAGGAMMMMPLLSHAARAARALLLMTPRWRAQARGY